MAIDQKTFDGDLQQFIAAVTAFIQTPAVVNLAAEDAQVKAALAQVQAASGGTVTPPTS